MMHAVEAERSSSSRRESQRIWESWTTYIDCTCTLHYMSYIARSRCMTLLLFSQFPVIYGINYLVRNDQVKLVGDRE